jgi:dUTP pyrophosphatase
MDSSTHRVKIATHCTFAEAGMMIPPIEQSEATKALQRVGFKNYDNCEDPTTEIIHPTPNDTQHTDTDITQHLKVKLLSDDAKLPVRATSGEAGYDLFCPTQIQILPGQRALVPTDVQLQLPAGAYLQIATRSGMAVKHLTDIKAGVIDSDFTGNVTVVLHNHGNETLTLNKGDRIAQFLILPIHTPPCIQVNEMP